MRRFKVVFIACIISFCWGKALAEIIRVPQDQPTIQSAIKAASSGDTVLVSPGVYRENINFMGKDIVVGSLFLTAGKKNYITETVIQADSGSVITFVPAKTKLTILTGFTITGGKGTKVDAEKDFVYGGGILILGTNPVIKNNLITRNAMWPSCFGRGGGIAIMDSANPLITGNAITRNDILGPCTHAAYYGGGIWVDATSNPIIGGSLSNANDIFSNSAVYGLELYREGGGKVINAQFNYFGGRCPPDSFDPFNVWPRSQFDISNCLKIPVTKVDDDNTRLPPTGFQLLQNYPNPFNAATTIEFHLSHPSQVSLEIFNLHGEKIATLLDRKKFMAGAHKINWQAEGLATGLYFYHWRANDFVETKKLILLK
ncbi:T9SS type A sorting domain-containing protein [bacterium]|nr:T9SS type A sorting domain-containing protein [bacterium]